MQQNVGYYSPINFPSQHSLTRIEGQMTDEAECQNMESAYGEDTGVAFAFDENIKLARRKCVANAHFNDRAMHDNGIRCEKQMKNRN